MKKHIYISIALSLLAPFTLLPFGNVIIWTEELILSVLSKVGWGPYYFGFVLSDEGYILLAFAPIVAFYIYIIWALRKLFIGYRSGAISKRSFIYPAIIAGLPPWLLLVSIV